MGKGNSAKTRMREQAKVVDTLQSCRAACADLAKEGSVAVDIEGVDLCRLGEVCIIQVRHAQNPSATRYPPRAAVRTMLRI